MIDPIEDAADMFAKGDVRAKEAFKAGAEWALGPDEDPDHRAAHFRSLLLKSIQTCNKLDQIVRDLKGEKPIRKLFP